jgi:DNA processing protein
MDPSTRLHLALAAAHSAHSESRLARRVRDVGVDAFVQILSELSGSQRMEIEHEADDLTANGVYAVLLGDSSYPPQLSQFRFAPPYLFCKGPESLLAVPTIGICGSRNASAQGIRAAEACGSIAAEQGFAVASGYARGVDITTHSAALASGGVVVVVLPEGINRFRVKRSISTVWSAERAVVISQFPPNRPWSAGSAMTRNNVIIGISQAVVVVEASDKGGTLAAGVKALHVNKRLFALEFTTSPQGNTMLLRRGAVAVQDRDQLRSRLAEISRDPEGNQLALI